MRMRPVEPLRPIPTRSPTVRPPSAPSRYEQRTRYSWPAARSSTVAVTPSASCSRATSSWLKRIMALVEALRVRLQHRLEPDLRQVGRPARARGYEVGVGVSAARDLQPAEASTVPVVIAGESGVPGGRPHVLRRRAAGEDLRRDAELGEDLHRALVEHVRLRQQGGSGIPGDQ